MKKHTLPPAIRAVLDMHSYKDKLAAVRAALKGGVIAVQADQLFASPAPVADRVILRADIRAGHRILEPSAGSGALLRAINPALRASCLLNAVEINETLAGALRISYPSALVCGADFFDAVPESRTYTAGKFPLGLFNRIVMNPPFADRADVKHVRHAVTFLAPRGRLVSVMLHGGDEFRPELSGEDPGTSRRACAVAELRAFVESRGLAMSVEELPAGSFAAQGTNVRTVLITID